MNKITFFILFLFLVGCDSENQAEINDIQKELNDLSKELNESSNRDLDLNRDGIPDITIEHEGNFFYELTDTNFDGKVDESWKYTQDNIQLGGKVDQDHNGILETEFVIKNGSFTKELADSNNNFIYDIYTNYNQGRIEYSEKYYSGSTENESAKIGKINYKFGYPDGPEVLKETKLTEKEFESARFKR